MHNIKILEYNISILDEDEVKLYDNEYDKLMRKAFKDVENIIFELDDGSKVPGERLCLQASKRFF